MILSKSGAGMLYLHYVPQPWPSWATIYSIFAANNASNFWVSFTTGRKTMTVLTNENANARPRLAARWLRATILAMAILSLTFIGFVASASADGAIQISGTGYWADVDECTTPSDGRDFDYNFKMDGDLVGCVYVAIATTKCTPSGIYIETGEEFYDIAGGTQGEGTFTSNYRFAGKFEACEGDDALAVEIFGRCQHPIAEGSGTGDFEGVTGRLDFKDDVCAGNFPYKGHLRW